MACPRSGVEKFRSGMVETGRNISHQLHATLTLIDRGVHSAATRGSMHGEYGQTQFMPKSILNHGGNFGR